MEDKLFNNVGKAIKAVALVIFVLDIIAAFIIGVDLLSNNDSTGIWYLLLGPVGAWICALFTYGFGILVENAEKELAQKRIVEAEKEAEQNAERLKKLTQNSPTPKATSGKWVCSCGNEHDNIVSFCEFCGDHKPKKH